jgi:spore photoproduct lyase
MAHILYYNRENRWLFILQVISYNRIMSLSTGRAGMLVSIMIFYNLENHSLFMAEEAGYTKPKGKKGDNPVFQPERVFFEKRALSYPLGEELYSYFQGQAIELGFTTSHNRVTGIPGRSKRDKFFHSKRTLVVGVRKSKNFATCKPSAHYQLPLATGCPGSCEYCYLHTNMGRNPYVRIYVNQEEILEMAKNYIDERLPETTIFEGAATADPLSVESYSGALARAIAFFAGQEHARFRFVTKFTDVDSLLELEHRGKTRFRFSINSPQVIAEYERATPRLNARLSAAEKVSAAGYPLGVMIAPIFLEGDWKKEYTALLEKLQPLAKNPDLTFELITHRFTARAKKLILDLFPETKLPLEEEQRTFKWGQFGYGKYLYPKEMKADVKAFFEEEIAKRFPLAKIDYFV